MVSEFRYCLHCRRLRWMVKKDGMWTCRGCGYLEEVDKPETRLMRAIFWYKPESSGYLGDDDLYQEVNGKSLRDALFELIGEIEQDPRFHPKFSARCRRLAMLRFGFEDGRDRTLAEIGREFGVTRETVRRTEAKLLRVLRHPSRARRLKAYIKGSGYDNC